jgi:hypothetical protein
MDDAWPACRRWMMPSTLIQDLGCAVWPARATVRAFSRATVAAPDPCSSIISRTSASSSISSAVTVIRSKVVPSARNNAAGGALPRCPATPPGPFCPGSGSELARPRDEPWPMRLPIRRLRTVIVIRRCAGALVQRDASFVDLCQLVDFRPLPKSAHLAINRNAHDRCSLAKVSSLEGAISRECHYQQHNKNRNDDRWNRPGSHGACPSLRYGVFTLCARKTLARRFALVICAGVSCAAIRAYPDRA